MKRLLHWLTKPEDPADRVMNAVKRLAAVFGLIMVIVSGFVYVFRPLSAAISGPAAAAPSTTEVSTTAPASSDTKQAPTTPPKTTTTAAPTRKKPTTTTVAPAKKKQQTTTTAAPVKKKKPTTTTAAPAKKKKPTTTTAAPKRKKPTTTTAAPKKKKTSPVQLRNLEVVAGEAPTVRDVTVDGVDYKSAMLTSRHGCLVKSTEFNLRGKYRRFRVTVGFTDESSTSYRWRFRVIAIENGAERELGYAELTDGQVGKIDVSVKGVRRFRLETTAPEGTGLWCAPDNDVIVWADAVLLP